MVQAYDAGKGNKILDRSREDSKMSFPNFQLSDAA